MGIIIICWVICFLIYFLLRIPRKKLIVNPTDYEYINHTYLYVDNKCYGSMRKREEIDKEEIIECINRVADEIVWRKTNKLTKNQINSIFHLREVIRKYQVKADDELIKKIDVCIEGCDYEHTCVLLEVRGILQTQCNAENKAFNAKVNIALFIVATLVAVLFFCNIRTILPIVNEYEYYETVTTFEKEGWEFITIHSENCPHKKNLWFKEKRKKYDMLIKDNAVICPDCIDEDEAKKLILLHHINLEEVRRFQSTYGVEENLSKYNTEAAIDNVYYLEDLDNH